ncbi:MAG: hypothetical protein NTV49_13465 [Kiritimatiellaeota bacterium]|nr:hypothetical protein [Kiritimatiellota bacterium]
MPQLSLDIIVFGIYLAIVTTVGFVASRKEKFHMAACRPRPAIKIGAKKDSCMRDGFLVYLGTRPEHARGIEILPLADGVHRLGEILSRNRA